MKLYERYFASNYEKLLTYYPRYYRDVWEMVEILKAQGRLADDLEESIEQVFLNCFIDYADEKKINQLEVFLKIGRNSSLTLDERRRVVKSYFLGAGKLSASQLAKMLQNITGCPEPDIRLEPIDAVGNNVLLIDFDCQENAAQKLAAVQELFSRKVPAHLKMLITAISRFDTKFPNKEHFQPISLLMPFYFSNQPNDITLLNGRRSLDGSWKLDSTFRGVVMRSFELYMAWQERQEIERGALFVPGIVLPNRERSVWSGLSWRGRLANRTGAGSKSLGLKSNFDGRQTGSMAGGSLTRDTMWRLDGSASLDGSKKLNAAIIKEEL